MNTWGKTLEQARAYAMPEADKVDFSIVSNAEKGHAVLPHLSMEDCEYLGTGFNFYYKLLEYEGMMIHASAVMMDGYAYLFAANPGTGKSTHTGLWQKVFGKDRAKILNDDKPAVRLIHDKVYAYGTPWSGKTDLNINTSVPLAGICILERGEQNQIERFAGANAIFELFKQTARPKDPKLAQLVLENLDKIMRRVPIWKLKCNMDPEAAMVSYEAMRPKCD